MTNNDKVMEILASAKKLDQAYRVLTGKPLGVWAMRGGVLPITSLKKTWPHVSEHRT